MPNWFKRKPEYEEDNIPEELRSLEPAEAAKRVKEHDAAVTAAAAAEAAKNTAEENYRNLNTAHEETKRRLQALEANNQGGNGGNGEGGQRRQERTEPISFYEDEDGAFNQRVAPLVQATAATGALTAKMSYLDTLRRQPAKAGQIPPIKLFEKYESEIDTIMSKEPAGARMNPDTWAVAYRAVIGHHMDEIITQAREGKGDFFAETGGSGGSGGGSGDSNQNKDELTPREKEIARKHRISEEDYLKQKKGMTIWQG